MIGSNAMIYVENLAQETLNVFADISNLASSQSYVARVSASNSFFTSVTSLSAISASPKLSNPNPVSNLYMATLSDTQLTVWWDAPVHDGGSPVTGYSIEWDTTLAFSQASNSIFVTDTSFTLSGLLSGAGYSVRVAAYNSQGYSQYVLAQSSIGWAAVHVIRISSTVAVSPSASFNIGFNDGYRIKTTKQIPYNAPTTVVQAALQALPNIRSVLVSLVDEVSSYDATTSAAYSVWYRITFISAAFNADPKLLTVIATGVTSATAVVNHGTALNSNVLTLVKTAPSAPDGVIVSIVSRSELGVKWNAPAFSGGLTVTKFLVEWDIDPYFIRSVNSSAYSEVVSVSSAAAANRFANYSYQITGLPQQSIYVRVSAFNGIESSLLGGYSIAAVAWPLNATNCSSMPIHCSTVPMNQLLYLPGNNRLCFHSQSEI